MLVLFLMHFMCRRDVSKRVFPNARAQLITSTEEFVQSVCQQDYGKNNTGPICGERRKHEEPITF